MLGALAFRSMCAHPRLGRREKCEGAQSGSRLSFAIEQACAANDGRWNPLNTRIAAALPKRIYA